MPKWGHRRRRHQKVEVIGRCWVCQGPVHGYDARRVADPYVTNSLGKAVRRLVHNGTCQTELAFRFERRSAFPWRA